MLKFGRVGEVNEVSEVSKMWTASFSPVRLLPLSLYLSPWFQFVSCRAMLLRCVARVHQLPARAQAKEC